MASSLLHDLLAGDFSRIPGLKMSGTVPLQQDLVNEALHELVESWSRPHEREKSAVPLAQMLKTVRKLAVQAEEGVIVVNFEIGV